MPNLVGQTAREFYGGKHALKTGLQGTAHTAETLLPHANMKTKLKSVEHSLIGDVHKAENAFKRTELGQEIHRGEHDLMRETPKLEHEFPPIGLSQEIRRSGVELAGDFHKVENEMAHFGFGEEVQKGEHHLEDEFRKLEYDQHKLGLGQGLRRGERDQKAGMRKVADHLHSDEQAMGRGAEAASRSVEYGVERLRRSAVKSAAIAGKLGTMVLDHALLQIRGPRRRVLFSSNRTIIDGRARRKGPLISGPQSMLNMFKARADAAIEESSDSPSFTDRNSHPPLVAVASRNCRADLQVFQ